MNKQTPAEMIAERFAARLDAEKAALACHYCTVFNFWRTCPVPRCRKARRCCGDAGFCLKHRGAEVPRRVQWQARQEVLQSTPANAGDPERTARELMPYDLV